VCRINRKKTKRLELCKTWNSKFDELSKTVSGVYCVVFSIKIQNYKLFLLRINYYQRRYESDTQKSTTGNGYLKKCPLSLKAIYIILYIYIYILMLIK